MIVELIEHMQGRHLLQFRMGLHKGNLYSGQVVTFSRRQVRFC